MEGKRKIAVINIVSIIMLVMCLTISALLIVLAKSKTEVEIAGTSADKLKNNYTTTEDTSNTWDVSKNGDGSIIATLSEDGTLTISGTGDMIDWTISSSVAWKSMDNKIKTVIIGNGITTIGNHAFYYCTNLTNIGIPESVTSIGNSAFGWCDNLTSIEIPEGVTSIGDWAFGVCGLTSIEIPGSVEHIGRDAFYYCTSLTSIEVAKSNSTYMDDNGVLYTKEGTEIIAYPIGKNDTEYTILNGTTSIGENAFCYGANLTSIEISESVTSIADWAFNDCISLTSINVNKNNKTFMDVDGVLYAKDGSEIIRYPEGKEKSEYAILNGATGIREGAFYNCYYLTKIEIPESVTSIGAEAFGWCVNLTSMEIPNSITNIGDDAFYNCQVTKLIDTNANIELPNILKRLQDENDILYSNNEFKLTNCTIEDSKIKIDEGADYAHIVLVGAELNGLNYVLLKNSWDVSKNGDGSVMATLTEDGTLTISGIGDMKDWNLLDDEDWHDIDYLVKSVIIENGVTNIGNRAFEMEQPIRGIGEPRVGGGPSLTNIEIPSSVTSIGDSAFVYCNNLENIEIPSSVTTIGENAFVGCDELTVLCYKDSTAQTYAQENGINYLIIMDGINPKTTVSEIGQNLENVTNYEITDKNGEVITETKYVGTGSKVTIADGENYIIIVTGDCNGDGEADIKDILAINKHRLNKASLEMEYLLASDVNEDGKVDQKDILQINKFRLGKIEEL